MPRVPPLVSPVRPRLTRSSWEPSDWVALLIAALVVGGTAWVFWAGIMVWGAWCTAGQRVGWTEEYAALFAPVGVAVALGVAGGIALRRLSSRWWLVLLAFVVVYIGALVVFSDVIAPAIWGASVCT